MSEYINKEIDIRILNIIVVYREKNETNINNVQITGIKENDKSILTNKSAYSSVQTDGQSD